MCTFFKISVYAAIIALFTLGLITLSDVFIHSNQLRFHIMTIIAAIIFLGMAFTGITIYKNFKIIYEYVSSTDEHKSVQKATKKMLFVFGFIAIAITLFTCSLCMGLIERMSSGTALFG